MEHLHINNFLTGIEALLLVPQKIRSIKTKAKKFEEFIKLPFYLSTNIQEIKSESFINNIFSPQTFLNIIFYFCVIKKINNFDLIQENFEEISELFLHKYSPNELQLLWNSYKKTKIRTSRDWTNEEDQTLLDLINSKNFLKGSKLKWKKIATEFNNAKPKNSISKCAKLIRNRWINHLNPNLKKGQWSKEEDLFILETYRKHKRQWCKITEILNNRNDHMVKNRFNQLIKQLKNVNNKNIDEKIEDLIQMIKNKKNCKIEIEEEKVIESKENSEVSEQSKLSKKLEKSDKNKENTILSKYNNPLEIKENISFKMNAQKLLEDICQKIQIIDVYRQQNCSTLF